MCSFSAIGYFVYAWGESKKPKNFNDSALRDVNGQRERHETFTVNAPINIAKLTKNFDDIYRIDQPGHGFNSDTAKHLSFKHIQFDCTKRLTIRHVLINDFNQNEKL